MLKKYAAAGKLRYVGKGWEIRRALRQAVKLHGGHARLAELPADKRNAKASNT